MGFRPEPKQYRLTFRDTDLEGLQVTMGSISVSEWNRMMASAATEDDPQARREANDFTLDLFASRIVEWNWEGEDGSVLPTTLEVVLSLDRSYVQQVLTAWQMAVVGIRPTQPDGSPNGESKITAEDLQALANASGTPGNS